MRRVIRLRGSLTDKAADRLAGEFLDDSHYDTLVSGEDCDVLKPDGTPLIKFRPGVIPEELRRVAYPILRKAATPTSNRGMAGGKVDPTRVRRAGVQTATRYQPLKADGTLSKTNHANVVESGVIGYFDRAVRFPYCRTTAFQMEHLDEIAKAMPFIRAVDGVFASEAPERYAAQLAMVERTSPDFYMHGTAFTTVTVNRNFQTAVHKDAGDLKEGFGVMTVLQFGNYDGGFTVFPKFRVAVDMRPGDVLLADVHEWHGNTALRGQRGRFERISCVFYYRENMAKCGSSAEELERAKRRTGGKLY